MMLAPATREAELAALARDFEPERYLAATLAGATARAALIALAAYAADLQRITATSTQPMLGEIRLQWWRDTLEIFGKGGRTGSPVADALGAAVAAHALPLPMLAAMSEARAWDLYDDPMPDQASLDGYLTKTEAIPFELALRVLGVAADEAGALSVPAGRAFGMMRLLARLAGHLAHGRIPLPLEMLAEHDLDRDRFLSDGADLALRALITSQSDNIRATLALLRPQMAALSKQQRTALLPLALVHPYLRIIERSRHDARRDIADVAPLTRVWRIGAAHLTGRI